jgi:hypothetical protein
VLPHKQCTAVVRALPCLPALVLTLTLHCVVWCVLCGRDALQALVFAAAVAIVLGIMLQWCVTLWKHRHSLLVIARSPFLCEVQVGGRVVRSQAVQASKCSCVCARANTARMHGRQRVRTTSHTHTRTHTHTHARVTAAGAGDGGAGAHAGAAGGADGERRALPVRRRGVDVVRLPSSHTRAHGSQGGARHHPHPQGI